VRLRPDFRPQRRHLPVDAARRDHNRIAPHRVQNVVARECAAAPGYETRQQAELLDRQFDLFAIAE
jgi:hypothetical protein